MHEIDEFVTIIALFDCAVDKCTANNRKHSSSGFRVSPNPKTSCDLGWMSKSIVNVSWDLLSI